MGKITLAFLAASPCLLGSAADFVAETASSSYSSEVFKDYVPSLNRERSPLLASASLRDCCNRSAGGVHLCGAGKKKCGSGKSCTDDLCIATGRKPTLSSSTLKGDYYYSGIGTMCPAWIPEEGVESDVLEFEGSTAKCLKMPSVGTPVNVLLKDGEGKGVDSGSTYWEFTIKSGDNVFVGLTTTGHFRPGWRIRGFFFGGNVSDGGALLIGSFGEFLSSGDKVGILLKREQGFLRYYVFQNGRPIGLAFELKEEGEDIGPLHPCVKFGEIGEVQVVESKEIPATLDRQPPSYGPTEGEWVAKEVTIESAVLSDDDAKHIKAKTRQVKEDELETSVFVINNLMTGFVKEADGTWKCSGIASTLMGGPPHLMSLEHRVSSVLNAVKNIEATSDGGLKLEGDRGAFIFKRGEIRKIEPCSRNPLKRS